MNKYGSDIPFDIPVALITFRRIDTTLKVLERISKVKPRKLYIISDAGRNKKEQYEVELCRASIEKSIHWNCEIVKLYANKNLGVHLNIVNGAMEVFNHEKHAIFLEDDNLPEVTFFNYCKEMLEIYEKNNKVLWICGTNYLKDSSETIEDYFFSKNMMPCGWASWAEKFKNNYDPHFSDLENKKIVSELKRTYLYSPLFNQDMYNWMDELKRFKSAGRYSSWDYQMSLILRSRDLYSIVPSKNQICNIGVDNFSTHGGNSSNLVMTERFCNLDTFPMKSGLKKRDNIEIVKSLELETEKIITYPYGMRLKRALSRRLKNFLCIDIDKSLKIGIVERLRVFSRK